MRFLLLGIALVVVGCIALPVSAYFLDTTEIGENLILPVDAAFTALAGAVLGAAVLPREHSPRRRALVGAGLGLLGAVVGLVAFFLLLNGFDGA
ncbi:MULTISPECIES: hypothetical protein [unclassified Nocardioides]|uniref:hypothetical protein n=1 Tax=unclassified Nocardioides TaxID=2615069 RepID=UPI0006FBB2A9|nr:MULTISPECIES: hypothetical protein [unclassified Nocardioides]KRA38782.1 hypothetical protein ASD81_09325 [Nocardioides sp. Root614]KRA92742.1 hypothetical protein ASD84_09590 [Nocardioides sp. Root682]